MTGPTDIQAPVRPGVSDQALLVRPDGSRPRILLAEDSAAARVLTSALLRRMGCDVDAVEHGEEALSHMRNHGYDMVLMDIEMPVMDGVAAAQQIRSLGGAAKETPIIALSAFLADSRKAKLWKEAFDASMPKPASRDQLHQTVQAVLRARAVEPQAGAEPAPPDAAAAAPPLIDDEALERLKGQLKPAAWEELIVTATREMREFAEKLQNAHGRGDLATMRHYSHKLHGIGSTFAAARLSALAGALEERLDNGAQDEFRTDVEDIRTCVDASVEFLASEHAA